MISQNPQTTVICPLSDEELDAAIAGEPLSAEQRAWCYDQLEFLSEFNWLDEPTKADDKTLAEAVSSASWDYVRCTCM